MTKMPLSTAAMKILLHEHALSHPQPSIEHAYLLSNINRTRQIKPHISNIYLAPKFIWGFGVLYPNNPDAPKPPPDLSGSPTQAVSAKAVV
jgi:hypothetical protein